jgi:hypothetical protein
MNKIIREHNPLKRIAKKPIIWNGNDKIHESIFRSYSIVEYIKQLCIRGTDPETMLDIIEFLQEHNNEPE